MTPHFVHDFELFKCGNLQSALCQLVNGGASHAAGANDGNIKRIHSAEFRVLSAEAVGVCAKLLSTHHSGLSTENYFFLHHQFCIQDCSASCAANGVVTQQNKFVIEECAFAESS